MYVSKHNTSLWSQQTVSHFDLTKFLSDFFFDFFFQNFRRHKHSTDVGIRNWRKNSKKESKKTLFTLRLRLFFFSLFSYQVYKTKSSQISWKKDRLLPSYDQTFIKVWIYLRLHLFFHQIDFWMMNWIICTPQSDFRKSKFWSKTYWLNKPQTLSKVSCQKAKMSTLIYEMEIHKVSRSKI